MSRTLKVATIGGGSSYTPELVEGFIRRAETLPIRELVLVDIPEGQEKLKIVGDLARRMVHKAGVDMEIRTSLDRREAIEGADFVTTQFRPGGIEGRILDERIPLAHGCIGQETTGAGGFAMALRAIPVALDICRDIEELAPEAWLINFANPSGIVTEAVLKHTKVKAVGLCNVPITMKQMVSRILDVSMERVHIEIAGLNHLFWGRRILLDGNEVTAQVLKEVASGRHMTMQNIPAIPWGDTLLESLGMLPCPYLRYYYLTDRMLSEERIEADEGRTRGEVVKRLESELFELYRNSKLDTKPTQLSGRGGELYSEAACRLMDSIHNDRRDLQAVNVRNGGTLPDLPPDVAIETQCIIGRQGPEPLAVGPLPASIRGLLQAVKAYEELTVRCAVEGDRRAGFLALLAHPLVPDASTAEALLDELLRAHRIELRPLR